MKPSPHFPSDRLGQPGARDKVTNMYLLPSSCLLKRALVTKRFFFFFFLNSCAVKCIFQLTKFTDLSRLDTLMIYNLKVYFLYLKTKVTAFNFL